ncbi:hypothetical protein OAT72_00930 [Alphaproteobacteria bacterium]|nr:hypothetical protein [Alphaproteobacteria bacterium]
MPQTYARGGPATQFTGTCAARFDAAINGTFTSGLLNARVRPADGWASILCIDYFVIERLRL